MFFNFRAFFLKMFIYDVVTFFSRLVLIQLAQFSRGKIYVLNELVILLTYSEELPPIKLHEISVGWSLEVTWKMKYIFPLTEDAWTPK